MGEGVRWGKTGWVVANQAPSQEPSGLALQDPHRAVSILSAWPQPAPVTLATGSALGSLKGKQGEQGTCLRVAVKIQHPSHHAGFHADSWV